MLRKLANYLVFQAGWLTCVWSAGAGLAWLGPLAVAGAVMLHLVQARTPRLECTLLALCAAVGLIFDSLLLSSAWVSYPDGSWIPGLAPYWIVALWVLFATTLNLSMAWLRGRPWTAALLGAIGGPLSYLAGENLGAVSLEQPAAALTAMALGWGLLMPILSWLASRLDGFAAPTAPEYIQSDWRAKGLNTHA